MQRSMSHAPPRTILLIHGAWMTPASWEGWRRRYDGLGHAVTGPAWPQHDRPVAELNATPDPKLGLLNVRKLVDHYARYVKLMPEPPILIGHSFGGLVVQMLLDRGLGACGVAIAPVPPAGIKPGLPALLTALPVLLTPGAASGAVRLPFARFARTFANGLPADQRREAWETQVVPEAGRLFYQAASGVEMSVKWANPKRPPLLLVAADDDRTVQPAMVRAAFEKHRAAPALTEFKTLPGRSHYLCNEPGWEALADDVLAWATANARPA